MNDTLDYEKELNSQIINRSTTITFIKIINELWYNHSVELVLFRRKLINKDVNEILNLYKYAEEVILKPISIFDSLEIAKSIQKVKLPSAKLDIGKLTHEYNIETYESNLISTDKFVLQKLINANKNNTTSPRDVVLYGFGRIGRLLARELMSSIGSKNSLRLKAIVIRGLVTEEILEKRAALLKNDSIHGKFSGSVKTDAANSSLIINGITIRVISTQNPEDVDYASFGIDNALLIDNTGAFRDKEALSRHLKTKGISKVLITAPGSGVPNIVHGVNHVQYNPNKVDIFSAASCTTNAITPILQVIDHVFGVNHGHLETIHAYTNDQNLVDNMHKKYRRGRAAALNMVITETGAGKAVSKALPSFEGKLTSNAIRVPVPNGSLAILNLRLDKKTSKEDINSTIKKYALEGSLVEQIQYSINNELVSSDIIGSSAPSIYDSNATIVDKKGTNVILYIWYDNEYGYSQQVMRLSKYIAKVIPYTYY